MAIVLLTLPAALLALALLPRPWDGWPGGAGNGGIGHPGGQYVIPCPAGVLPPLLDLVGKPPLLLGRLLPPDLLDPVIAPGEPPLLQGISVELLMTGTGE